MMISTVGQEYTIFLTDRKQRIRVKQVLGLPKLIELKCWKYLHNIVIDVINKLNGNKHTGLGD